MLPMPDINYASRSSRLLGQVLDGAIAAAPLLLIVLFDTVDIMLPFIGVAAVVAAIAYYFLSDGLPGGQSLGKRVLGIHVIVESTGEPCSFARSLVRNLILALLGPLDWVFIFGAKHQRLGDMAAGTIVVYR